jgi:hypothetical protein
MKRFAKFFRLSRTERYLLIHAVLLILTIRLGLSLLAFQQVLKIRCRLKSFQRKWSSNPPPLYQISWALDTASRYIPGAKCLARALAGQLLIARWGIPTSIHIGVKKNGESALMAHAWLEFQGRILIGNAEDLSQYTRLSCSQHLL